MRRKVALAQLDIQLGNPAENYQKKLNKQLKKPLITMQISLSCQRCGILAMP